MNRQKSAEAHRQPFAAKVATPSANPELSRLRRRLAIVAALSIFSLAAAAWLWADWYYGLPVDATATFVGRQSCIQCHQTQSHAWQGSHHDLAMDVAKDMT